MRVYKYCDHQGVSILRQLRLKVTPPNEFNDIFEFRPTPNKAASVKWADPEEIVKVAPQLRKRLAARGKVFNGDDDAFTEFLKENITEPCIATQQQVGDMCASIVDHISKTHGLICLSKRRNSLLMWSHYADSHKGIVIGFEIPPHLRALDVDYGSRRIPWNFSLERTDREVVSDVEKLLRTKSIHWRYEREVRLVWALRDCIHDADCNGQRRYFQQIPPECFKEVILGYRCERNSDLERSVYHWIEENQLTVELNSAEPSASRFGLTFRPA